MEKKLINIYNTAKDEDNYLKLTDNEVAFLNWLQDMGYLDENTDFDEIGALPTPIEF
jgi:hypothetical protein